MRCYFASAFFYASLCIAPANFLHRSTNRLPEDAFKKRPIQNRSRTTYSTRHPARYQLFTFSTVRLFVAKRARKVSPVPSRIAGGWICGGMGAAAKLPANRAPRAHLHCSLGGNRFLFRSVRQSIDLPPTNRDGTRNRRRRRSAPMKRLENGL